MKPDERQLWGRRQYDRCVTDRLTGTFSVEFRDGVPQIVRRAETLRPDSPSQRPALDLEGGTS